VPFGLAATRRAIETALAAAGSPGTCVLRRTSDGHPFVTDGGHLIFDAALGHISQPERLALGLAMIPGVVEHGLFIGMAQTAVLAGPQGVRIVERS
jgi:ribose 5-phosphate isomerase A